MGTFRLTNVGDPTSAQDAATKNYVDVTAGASTNTASTLVRRDGSGNFAAGTITATAFLYTSDRRFKHDIRKGPGLDELLKLQGVRFKWNRDGSEEIGLIAQDVERVMPELVVTNPATGYKAVKYGNLVSPLIESVRELNNKCEMSASDLAQLRQELRQHDQRISDLEQRVKKLENENQELRKVIYEIRESLPAKR